MAYNISEINGINSGSNRAIISGINATNEGTKTIQRHPTFI